MAKKGASSTVGALPVLQDSPRKGPLGLSMGQWRSVVLVLVHLLVFAHIWHFLKAGSTISPVEPSETAETLREGLINAGAIFFALTILSTLVLGRWFCGWACHVVAYQDLARWLLMKVGITPRPVRSRLLLFVPLFAAAWLFGQPLVRSLFGGLEHPVELSLTTENFWRTFPGLTITLLTFLVCGFLIIYVLGAKGFCTYGCPYGAIFVMADRVAPGRIRVTEDCSACGICSQVCSSNVRVAKEVIEHGKVVDPGCMKCMDCVTGCPTNALYFGFKSQSQGKGKGKKKRPGKAASRFDFNFQEEIFLAGLFLVSFAVYYDFYGRIPFLLALGLGSITAYLGAVAMRLLERQDVRFQNLRLRREGRLTGAGKGYVAVMGLILAFLLHGAYLQWQTRQGRNAFDQASAAADPATRDRLAAEARGPLERVARWGLVDTRGVGRMLAQIHLWNDEPEAAVADLRREVGSGSRNPAVYIRLGETLVKLGNREEGREVFRAVLSDTWTSPGMYLALLQRLAPEKREARIFLLDGGLRRHPEDPQLREGLCAEVEAAESLRQDPEVSALRGQCAAIG